MKKGLYIFITSLILVGCTSAKYKDLNDGLYAEIQTNKGDILLELYTDAAPMTVANLVSLAEGDNNKVYDSIKGDNYYDGIRFQVEILQKREEEYQVIDLVMNLPKIRTEICYTNMTMQVFYQWQMEGPNLMEVNSLLHTGQYLI